MQGQGWTVGAAQDTKCTAAGDSRSASSLRQTCEVCGSQGCRQQESVDKRGVMRCLADRWHARPRHTAAPGRLVGALAPGPSQSPSECLGDPMRILQSCFRHSTAAAGCYGHALPPHGTCGSRPRPTAPGGLLGCVLVQPAPRKELTSLTSNFFRMRGHKSAR